VIEREPPGVQRLPRELPAPGAIVLASERTPLTARVHGITDDSVAGMGQVNSNLVGSARDRPTLDPDGAVELLLHTVQRPGHPTRRHDRHPLPFAWVTADGSVDHALGILGNPVTNREVGLFDLAPPKRECQPEMRSLALGHDQGTGGVLIEPVDDPGPFGASYSGQVVAVAEQRIHESARTMPARRVDDQPRLLVDHQQVAIFVEHVERDRLGLQVEPTRRGLVDLDPVSRPDRSRRLGLPVVQEHTAVVDQPPHPRPCPPFFEGRQTAVETAARQVVGNGEAVPGAHGSLRREIQMWKPAPIATRIEVIN
jgi:hypothetical protein